MCFRESLEKLDFEVTFVQPDLRNVIQWMCCGEIFLCQKDLVFKGLSGMNLCFKDLCVKKMFECLVFEGYVCEERGSDWFTKTCVVGACIFE